ncbi:hypothetical protein N658DRAFT_62918 [Parathielavia hyrcaniae]|uniref:Uncharacterized protein n=1 Tax=Parathielavia hyrcaniae TaxID=113614 RepID=A0AAN6Q2B4_9PEZI|nr:hypothetical protein N658DRAFT_62918 [Parathielavia hyrcaniae]
MGRLGLGGGVVCGAYKRNWDWGLVLCCSSIIYIGIVLLRDIPVLIFLVIGVFLLGLGRRRLYFHLPHASFRCCEAVVGVNPLFLFVLMILLGGEGIKQGTAQAWTGTTSMVCIEKMQAGWLVDGPITGLILSGAIIACIENKDTCRITELLRASTTLVKTLRVV